MKFFYTLFLYSILIVSSLTAQTLQRPPAAVYINLLDPAKAVMDGVATVYGKEYSDFVDNVDAQKLWNPEIENMALIRHDTALAIEFRHIPKLIDTIFIRLYLRQHPYILQFFSANIPAKVPARAWLVDKYLNVKTDVSLHDTTLYNFIPNSDTNSYRNRFMVVLNRQLLTMPVPVSEAPQGKNPNSITVTSGKTQIAAVIYPNPVTATNAFLNFTNVAAGNYEVTIFNAWGNKLFSMRFRHDGAYSAYNLPVKAQWPAGFYMVNVQNISTAESVNLKLLISR